MCLQENQNDSGDEPGAGLGNKWFTEGSGSEGSKWWGGASLAATVAVCEYRMSLSDTL